MSTPAAKSVIVTGASAGIGMVTAVYLAQRGYRVLATSRETSRLDGLVEQARQESIPITPYKLDVNDPASIADVVSRMLRDTGGIDALVNNAGYGLRGCLEDLSIDEVRAQFETNVYAVLGMSQAVLPQMRQRGSGTIVNVGSVAGQIASPGGGAYSATKFALRALSNVMRMEVASFGVRVVLLEPGLFRTDFLRNQVVGQRSLDPNSPYYQHTEKMRRNQGGNMRWGGNPIRVARTIARVLGARHPGARYTVGLESLLGAMAARLVPDGLLQYLVRQAIWR